MRAVWSLILLTSGAAFALSTSKFAEDITQNALETNNKTDSNLNLQCSHFVKSCLGACEGETINNFNATCSSREATCICNDVDLSAKVFATMLQGVPGAITTDKNKLQVEASNTKGFGKGLLKPMQFNAVLGDADEKAMNEASAEATREALVQDGEQTEEEGTLLEEDADATEREYQQMEFIHPQPLLVKRPSFQEDYCASFMIRCKQDCPAAFNSYSCNANKANTGFLLSCVCNYVDIAASVDAQVQAESPNN